MDSGRVGPQAGLSGFLQKGLWPAALVIGVYFAVSVLIRLLLPDGLTLDEAEQSLFSQYLLAGYGPQPPFYNWVQNAFVEVMGISVLSLMLPKFIMLLLCYVFFGMAARELDLRPGFVAMAMFSLLTLPQVSYMPQQDLTHTIAVLMATALFFYGLLRTLSRPDWLGYALLGLALGIGTISKYNFVLLPLSALVAVLLDRQWRLRLFDVRVLLTALIAIVIVAPHALWLLNNLDLASAGTLGKMVDPDAPQGIARIIRAVLSLVMAVVAFSALTMIIFAIAFKRDFRASLTAGNRWTRLLGTMMLVCLLGVVVVILVTGSTKITERWLNPYLLSLPLYLLLKLEQARVDTGASLKRFVPLFLVLMAITLLPLAGKTLTAGITGSTTRLNMPFRLAAATLRAEQHPTLIIAEGMHLSGNLRLQFPYVPVLNGKQSVDGFPPKTALRGPVLVVWANGDTPRPAPPFDLADILAANGLVASQASSLSLPYGDGSDRLSLGYIWLRQQ